MASEGNVVSVVVFDVEEVLVEVVFLLRAVLVLVLIDTHNLHNATRKRQDKPHDHNVINNKHTAINKDYDNITFISTTDDQS